MLKLRATTNRAQAYVQHGRRERHTHHAQHLMSGAHGPRRAASNALLKTHAAQQTFERQQSMPASLTWKHPQRGTSHPAKPHHDVSSEAAASTRVPTTTPAAMGTPTAAARGVSSSNGSTIFHEKCVDA